MPAITMIAAMTSSATTLMTTLSLGPPSSPITVEVASTESTHSTVSHPTVSSQEMIDGSRLPFTPKAARLSTIVGADPRLPASEMKPQNRNEIARPTTLTMLACQKFTPKPSTNEP
ncbi:hypothetical protein GCM10025881_26210 [Pseudolysinimonas kribbensis]|uniref:Secreted protein n=1 Tax=Pseudolysinimonas kribbensis TaxID=433641 RepID=A0ABQ6K766_9MICO|nr:hypothetical protein GCM10025881_26210 [Pseudolysinimonas kribbensis]